MVCQHSADSPGIDAGGDFDFCWLFCGSVGYLLNYKGGVKSEEYNSNNSRNPLGSVHFCFDLV